MHTEGDTDITVAGLSGELPRLQSPDEEVLRLLACPANLTVYVGESPAHRVV